MYIIFLNVAGLSNIHTPLQALDIFNTAVVSPVYYVMFTICTIVASMIMFKVIPTPNS